MCARRSLLAHLYLRPVASWLRRYVDMLRPSCDPPLAREHGHQRYHEADPAEATPLREIELRSDRAAGNQLDAEVRERGLSMGNKFSEAAFCSSEVVLGGLQAICGQFGLQRRVEKILGQPDRFDEAVLHGEKLFDGLFRGGPRLCDGSFSLGKCDDTLFSCPGDRLGLETLLDVLDLLLRTPTKSAGAAQGRVQAEVGRGVDAARGEFETMVGRLGGLKRPGQVRLQNVVPGVVTGLLVKDAQVRADGRQSLRRRE